MRMHDQKAADVRTAVLWLSGTDRRVPVGQAVMNAPANIRETLKTMTAADLDFYREDIVRDIATFGIDRTGALLLSGRPGR